MRGDIRAARAQRARESIVESAEKLSALLGVAVTEKEWQKLEHPRGNTQEQALHKMEAVASILGSVVEGAEELEKEADLLAASITEEKEAGLGDLDGLLEIEGIGPKTLEAIKAHLKAGLEED